MTKDRWQREEEEGHEKGQQRSHAIKKEPVVDVLWLLSFFFGQNKKSVANRWF